MNAARSGHDDSTLTAGARRDAVRQNEASFEEWMRCLGLGTTPGDPRGACRDRIVAAVAEWAQSPAGRSARRRLPSGVDVADFMQELILSMLSRRHVDDVGEAYLQTAAKNRARSELRSSFRQRRRPYPAKAAARERIEPIVEEHPNAHAGSDVRAILSGCLKQESYELFMAAVLDEPTDDALKALRQVDARTLRRWSKDLRDFLRQHSELARFAPASG